MRRLAVVLLLSALLGGCGDNLTPRTEPAPTPAPVAPTGLSPEIATALRRDSEGLVVETASDGSQMVNLQGRFRHVSYARRNPDGTITVTSASANAERTRLIAPPVREFK